MASEWLEAGKVLLEYATKPRYSFVAWVAALAIIFLPGVGITAFANLRESYKDYLWAIWLVAFLIWTVEIGLMSKDAVIDWRKEVVKKKASIDYLATLSLNEFAFLVQALDRNTQSVEAGREANAPLLLCEKGLLQRVPTDGKPTNAFTTNPYYIPDFVWKHITQPAVSQSLKDLHAKAKQH